MTIFRWSNQLRVRSAPMGVTAHVVGLGDHRDVAAMSGRDDLLEW